MKTCLMPWRLELICSTVSSLRDSSLKDGSPILVVPPPISAMGRCPVFCIQRSIMIWTSDPACRLVAVASNPMYPVIRPVTAAASKPSGSEIWWMNPRSDRTLRNSDLNMLMTATREKGGRSYHGSGMCQNR